MTKGDLAERIGLNEPLVEWDGALPHEWLEGFLSFCKKWEEYHTITHPLITSTTFWVYYKDDAMGRPVSGCTEVQDAIDSYIEEVN